MVVLEQVEIVKAMEVWVSTSVSKKGKKKREKVCDSLQAIELEW